MKLRWPRGRYNGRRIVGVKLTFRFSLEHFNWRPKSPKYSNCVHWLWFWVWMYWDYADFDRKRTEANK
jgi:hypothetical protein